MSDVEPAPRLDEIQDRLHEWRSEEYPEWTERAMVTGAMQELGEVAEVLDKGEFYHQAEYSDEELMDEIGDVVIYMIGLASMRGYSAEECLQMAAEKVLEDRDWSQR